MKKLSRVIYDSVSISIDILHPVDSLDYELNNCQAGYRLASAHEVKESFNLAAMFMIMCVLFYDA